MKVQLYFQSFRDHCLSLTTTTKGNKKVTSMVNLRSFKTSSLFETSPMSRMRAEEEVDECSSPPQNVRLENFTQVGDRGGFRPPLHVPIRPGKVSWLAILMLHVTEGGWCVCGIVLVEQLWPSFLCNLAVEAIVSPKQSRNGQLLAVLGST